MYYKQQQKTNVMWRFLSWNKFSSRYCISLGYLQAAVIKDDMWAYHLSIAQHRRIAFFIG